MASADAFTKVANHMDRYAMIEHEQADDVSAKDVRRLEAELVEQGFDFTSHLN